MAIAVEIVLTSDEKNRLEKNIRSRKTSVRLQERSWIVLLASEGMLNGSIADELGIGKNKVGRGAAVMATIVTPELKRISPAAVITAVSSA